MTKKKYVLQLCHGYGMPFTDVARQYASLFEGTPYHVITVYLTGLADDNVDKQTASDTVLFLENTSRDLRGLKRKQIKQIQRLHDQYDFDFAIAHRYKAIYILSHLKHLPVIGVHHAFDVYSRFMRRFFIIHQQRHLLLLGVSNAISDDIKKSLPSFPEADKVEQNLVHGCQSQVWIIHKFDADDNKLYVLIDSDAIIVKGLAAVVLSILNAKTAEEIKSTDVEGLFTKMDLMRHISPTRGNGLRSMLERIRNIADNH